MQKYILEVEKYAFKVQKYPFEVRKFTLKVHKNTLEVQKYTFRVQRCTLELHYASILSKYKSILWKYKSIPWRKNPKARLLRVLFDSIDFLALFGVYAGIILLFLFNCAKSFLVEHWADKRVQKVDLGGGGEYICIYIYIYICVHLPL